MQAQCILHFIKMKPVDHAAFSAKLEELTEEGDEELNGDLLKVSHLDNTTQRIHTTQTLAPLTPQKNHLLIQRSYKKV